MLKAIILDMDGVMIDTEKLYAIFWKKAIEYYGYHPTHEFLMKLRSLARPLGDRLFKETFGEAADYYAIREKRLELMNAYIDEHGVEMKQGLIELLTDAKNKGVKLGVATATDEVRTKRYLNQLHIIEFFDVIVCGPQVAHGKPAPDIYLRACELLEEEPKNCLALEDSPNGIMSAYNAGCRVIMIPDQEEPEKELYQYFEQKVTSLSEIKLDISD